jgi:ketosteroid isomerase-like protein
VLDSLHPDVEWEENPDVPGLDPVYRGHAGFLKRQRDAFDAWEWFKVEEQEFIDAGEDVVVFLRAKGKGRHSGIEVGMSLHDVFTFRVARLYATRDEAFRGRRSLEVAPLPLRAVRFATPD